MGKRQKMLHAAKRIAVLPETIDRLLHGEVLRNPSYQQQEKQMPDIKTALQTALDRSKREMLNDTMKAWEQDEQQLTGEVMQAKKQFGSITNNASRETFAFIKNNPGLRFKDITERLVSQGFKHTTVSSLLYQMATAGLVRNDRGIFTAIADEFSPFSIAKIRKAKQKAQKEAAKAIVKQPIERNRIVVVKRRTAKDAEAAHNANVAGIGALTVNAEQPVQYKFTPTNVAWKPEDTVDQLTLVQAKAVHAYLQKIFGAL